MGRREGCQTALQKRISVDRSWVDQYPDCTSRIWRPRQPHPACWRTVPSLLQRLLTVHYADRGDHRVDRRPRLIGDPTRRLGIVGYSGSADARERPRCSHNRANKLDLKWRLAGRSTRRSYLRYLKQSILWLLTWICPDAGLYRKSIRRVRRQTWFCQLVGRIVEKCLRSVSEVSRTIHQRC